MPVSPAYRADPRFQALWMTPLGAEFPQNPMFQLILGDTQAKLNRTELAAASFRAAARAPISGTACAERVRALAEQAQAALAGGAAR